MICLYVYYFLVSGQSLLQYILGLENQLQSFHTASLRLNVQKCCLPISGHIKFTLIRSNPASSSLVGEEPNIMDYQPVVERSRGGETLVLIRFRFYLKLSQVNVPLSPG